MGLLPPESISKLVKKNIKTPELLYYYIQDDPDSIALLLGLSKENTLALGTLILRDWADIKFLKLFLETCLENTGQPISIFFKRSKFFS